MLHARKDYDRIQDPIDKIPSKEPVFLLRGQDRLAIPILAEYIKLTLEYSGPSPITESLAKHLTKVRKWQDEKCCKAADMLTP